MPEEEPRWNQLTYTSADAAGGTRGGWGVKAVTAGAPDAVVDRLRQGVTTRIAELEETSQFASASQLEQRPHRLSYLTVDGMPTLWHAVPAGPDATGRPGNVFTHAATLIVDQPELRAIEYWRSPDWLTPFGVLEVNAARLGALRPGSFVTRSSTLEFLAEPDRLYSLEWLLAAVSHVFRTRRSMVLLTDTVDEAARWLSTFSYLTAPMLARRIGWATFERAEGVVRAAARGVTVICVPRADYAILVEERSDQVLLADPRWVLDDPVAGTWVNKLSQTFPAEPAWQDAALDVLALAPEHRDGILTQMDALGRVPADEAADLPFAWPLLMSLLVDGNVAVADREASIRECLFAAPTSVFSDPRVQGLVQELVQGSPAAVSLEAGAPPALRSELQLEIAKAYLSGGWRAGRSAPEVDAALAGRLRESSSREILAAINQAEDDASNDSQHVGRAAELVSFLLTHELDPPPAEDEDPSPIAMAVEVLRQRLPAPDTRSSDIDVSGLHPILLAPASRPEEAESADPLAAAPPPPSFPLSRSPTPDDVTASIGRLLTAAEPGTARAAAIAECLLLVHGYSSGSDRSRPEILADPLLTFALACVVTEQPVGQDGRPSEADAAVVEAAWSSPATPSSHRHWLCRWLSVYWAMRESGGVERGGATAVVPEPLVEEVRRDPDCFVEALARHMAEARTDEAAQFVHAALRSHLQGQALTLLAVLTPDGAQLGWTAVQRAATLMDREGLRATIDRVRPRLDGLEQVFGSRVSMMLDRLVPFAGQNQPHTVRLDLKR